MIARITGTVHYHGAGFLIVECGGVGYKIQLPDEVAQTLRGEVSLYTHQVVREDAHELFGFLTMDAMELFWKLVAVSGVGPRTAQRIVNAGKVSDVKASIMAGQLSFLTNISGIGKKTAQKIILELKGALAEDPSAPAVDAEALEALVSLGYQKREAEEVLGMIQEGNTEERIRRALKLLGKR